MRKTFDVDYAKETSPPNRRTVSFSSWNATIGGKFPEIFFAFFIFVFLVAPSCQTIICCGAFQNCSSWAPTKKGRPNKIPTYNADILISALLWFIIWNYWATGFYLRASRAAVHANFEDTLAEGIFNSLCRKSRGDWWIMATPSRVQIIRSDCGTFCRSLYRITFFDSWQFWLALWRI